MTPTVRNQDGGVQDRSELFFPSTSRLAPVTRTVLDDLLPA